MKSKKIKIPIYFGDLVIIIFDKWDEINKKCDTSIIVHETVHLVNYIFRERGLILDLEDDEAQAYLTGWVFNSINKYYSKNKKSV